MSRQSWTALALGLFLVGCAQTTECRDNDDCGVQEDCVRGTCRAICKAQVTTGGEVIDLTAPCPDPEKMRCVCVPTRSGSTCSDPDLSDCDPILDSYCLCYNRDDECNPRCLPGERCAKGACIADET